MALEYINRNESVLPGYWLQLDWRNSKCLPGVGMKGLFELLSEPPIKPVLLGASCSVVSQPVAETAQHWNLVQMSFSSASDVLSVRDRFKYFFRTCPAQSAMNQPRIRFLQEYGWNRVAVIIESNEYFASAIDFFISDLEESGMELLTSESFPAGTKPTHQLENIKRKDGRVIVASAYEEGIKMIFCEAYKLGMYGPRYVWMIESWNSDHWWRNTNGINCTEDEMVAVTEYYVGTVFLDVRPDDTVTISGLTSNEYRNVFAEFTNHKPIEAEDFAPFGYDALWAVALALHQVDMDVKQNSSLPNITEFDYENKLGLRQRIFDKLSTLQFEGITVSKHYKI
ncbi:gamma-aminobutyric acid type B receptor subunit 1-like [Amphiura filiformis]|uniref:gamma-aminobutyric acid type B receptor subunit 1-like n=1 Tax=Amphiura filiformis TaxID=82378 RepID=UPI003B22896A